MPDNDNIPYEVDREPRDDEPMTIDEIEQAMSDNFDDIDKSEKEMMEIGVQIAADAKTLREALNAYSTILIEGDGVRESSVAALQAGTAILAASTARLNAALASYNFSVYALQELKKQADELDEEEDEILVSPDGSRELLDRVDELNASVVKGADGETQQ